MDSMYPVAAVTCVIALGVRTTYEALKRAGRVRTENPAIFAAVFVAMVAMLGSWPVVCPLDPWRVATPVVLEWLATGLLVAAFGLALGGLAQLRGLEGIDHLVTTGLFARLRHPMYTGFILWMVGWVARSGAPASSVIGLAAIANILFWRHLEEEALESRYGSEYRLYRGRTWF